MRAINPVAVLGSCYWCPDLWNKDFPVLLARPPTGHIGHKGNLISFDLAHINPKRKLFSLVRQHTDDKSQKRIGLVNRAFRVLPPYFKTLIVQLISERTDSPLAPLRL